MARTLTPDRTRQHRSGGGADRDLCRLDRADCGDRCRRAAGLWLRGEEPSPQAGTGVSERPNSSVSLRLRCSSCCFCDAADSRGHVARAALFDSFFRAGSLAWRRSCRAAAVAGRSRPFRLVGDNAFWLIWCGHRLPGPLFTFAAYLERQWPQPNGVAGARSHSVAIFCPASSSDRRIALLGRVPHATGSTRTRGANAAVAGILEPPLASPRGLGRPSQLRDFACASAAFFAAHRVEDPTMDRCRAVYATSTALSLI